MLLAYSGTVFYYVYWDHSFSPMKLNIKAKVVQSLHRSCFEIFSKVVAYKRAIK